MTDILEKMTEETYSVARKLGLEASKSLKLESNTQTGYFFRITLKVFILNKILWFHILFRAID